MPYEIRDNCVYKEGQEEALKCYDTKEEALAYLRALEANVPEAHKASIKAVGDWELEVNAAPFVGTDRDKQWFDQDTDFMLDNMPVEIPVVYYHGLKDNARDLSPESFSEKPIIIGKVTKREKTAIGLRFNVLLNQMVDKAKDVMEAAKNNLAVASSGTVQHLARLDVNGKQTMYSKNIPGRISVWPIAELSLWDLKPGKLYQSHPYAVAIPALKAVYEQANIQAPDILNVNDDQNANSRADVKGATARGQEAKTSGEADNKQSTNHEEIDKMANEVTLDQVSEVAAKAAADAVASALEAQRKAEENKREAEKAEKDKIDAAVKAALDEQEKKYAEAGRLPLGGAPVVAKYGYTMRYNNESGADLAFAAEALKAAGKPVSENLYRAMAIKLCDEASDKEHASRSVQAMKASGFGFDGTAIKADEVNYSTLASYGDEWVVTANSNALWEQIRSTAQIVPRIPSIEVPQGSEAIKIPLESTDPKFYKVSQVTSDAATGGLSRPAPTVPSSLLGTANQTLTVNKMGARVRWSGEMDEDSIVPFAPQLRMQMATVGAEYLDHVVLDGDTRTTASTNINDIGGTPGGTEAFLLANGMRYVALVTTGRYRSGGALDEDDFVATMRLLGTAGIAAADPTKVAFIIDPWTHFQMLTEITALKTADVYPGNPTIESGKVTNIWGRPVLVSYQLGYVYKYSPHTMTTYENKFTTAGKIDQNTASNNTTGMILLPRFDRWFFGWKRRMTVEVTRYPEWDGSEIVALTRFGLIYRDTTNAAAISYNVTI